MNHDELLIKIDEFNSVLGDNIRRPFFNALSAVVDLHKPEQYQTFEVCSECISDKKSMLVPIDEIYPCRTIKAIEKELSGE